MNPNNTTTMSFEGLRYANPQELDSAISTLQKLKNLREEVSRLLQTPILGGSAASREISPAVKPTLQAATPQVRTPMRRRRRRMAGPRPGSMRETIYGLLHSGCSSRKELIQRLAQERGLERHRAEEAVDAVVTNRRDPFIRRIGYGSYTIQGFPPAGSGREHTAPAEPASAAPANTVEAPRSGLSAPSAHPQTTSGSSAIAA
jgi:hypothetical protein